MNETPFLETAIHGRYAASSEDRLTQIFVASLVPGTGSRDTILNSLDPPEKNHGGPTKDGSISIRPNGPPFPKRRRRFRKKSQKIVRARSVARIPWFISECACPWQSPRTKVASRYQLWG